jgi:hypothetical protein
VIFSGNTPLNSTSVTCGIELEGGHSPRPNGAATYQPGGQPREIAPRHFPASCRDATWRRMRNGNAPVCGVPSERIPGFVALPGALLRAGMRCPVGAFFAGCIFPKPHASSASDAPLGHCRGGTSSLILTPRWYVMPHWCIPLAPTGRPHTSPGATPGNRIATFSRVL